MRPYSWVQIFCHLSLPPASALTSQWTLQTFQLNTGQHWQPSPLLACFFHFSFLRQDHRQPWLAWNSLCRQSCSRTHRDDSASAPGILGLKMFATTPGSFLSNCIFSYLLYVYECVWGRCMRYSMYVEVGGHLVGIVLSFCLINHMDRTQIVKCAGECSSLLNQLSMTWLFISIILPVKNLCSDWRDGSVLF